jgi:hypothetical protein
VIQTVHDFVKLQVDALIAIRMQVEVKEEKYFELK